MISIIKCPVVLILEGVLVLSYLLVILGTTLFEKIKPLQVIEFIVAFVGEYFFSNTAIGDILVNRAAREVFHELNMRLNYPVLHADWLDRRTQIFELHFCFLSSTAGIHRS